MDFYSFSNTVINSAFAEQILKTLEILNTFDISYIAINYKNLTTVKFVQKL